MDSFDDLTLDQTQKLNKDEVGVLKNYFDLKGNSSTSQTSSNSVWTVVYLTIVFALLNVSGLQFIFDKISYNRNVHLAVKALIFFLIAYLIILKLN